MNKIYCLIMCLLIIILIGLFTENVYEPYVTFRENTDIDFPLDNELKKAKRMERLKEIQYVDLETMDDSVKGFGCTDGLCDMDEEIDREIAQEIQQEADKNVVEGFIGTGPGEYNVPQDPVTGEKCCPACFSPVMINGKKECQQVCTNGDYQDYSCLSTKAFNTLFYGDKEEAKKNKTLALKQEKKNLKNQIITIETQIREQELILETARIEETRLHRWKTQRKSKTKNKALQVVMEKITSLEKIIVNFEKDKASLKKRISDVKSTDIQDSK